MTTYLVDMVSDDLITGSITYIEVPVPVATVTAPVSGTTLPAG